MNALRKLLFPFSILYDGITHTRNSLYDRGIKKTHTFEVPMIVVGNLRVGGTGKTPMVEYLIRLLQETYKVAVLSRGYKRKSVGFVWGDENSTAETLGDEPFQLYRKFPKCTIAVDANRVQGITQLLTAVPSPEVILLDDAFQHRQVQAGFNIVLTSYDDLYVDDQVLPTGNLRENPVGAQRAQVIVVTKCPPHLTEQQEFEIAQKLKPTLHQTVFFSAIQYAAEIVQENKTITISECMDYSVLLVTGIANPQPLKDFLESKHISFKHLSFPDHHAFTTSELAEISRNFNDLYSNKKLILTTEKDYVRIFATLSLKNEAKVEDWYYLPIETGFIRHQKDFDQIILDYVEQSTRNRSIPER
jgi:tetraacyldisaccharide 4'-kinase